MHGRTGTLGAEGGRTYHCEYAWLGGETATAGVNVRIEGEHFAEVEPGAPPPGASRLAGLSLPGFANAHSHAFHRVLRGRGERRGGSFFTWREEMYKVASSLEPDSYRALATATYAEMVLAGYTCVGEFHYLHRDRDAKAYAEPNAMAAALVEAAREAGIRITVLDACYLEGGPGAALQGAQLRFADDGAEGWAARTGSLDAAADVLWGAAIHSVRAVPPAAARLVAETAAARGVPLHFHLSEQPLENEVTAAAYGGATPAALLEQAGAFGPSSTAVHATHLARGDLGRLASSATRACICPTTERDLGDGIGPAYELHHRGSPLCVGSDSQAVVDPFEELRALELDERLASGRRGRFDVAELLGAGTAGGHAALGWPAAGRLVPGAVADLVTLSLDSVRLAGAEPAHLLEQAIFAASAADVQEVVVSGRHVVSGGAHLRLDVAPALASAIASLRSDG